MIRRTSSVFMKTLAPLFLILMLLSCRENHNHTAEPINPDTTTAEFDLSQFEREDLGNGLVRVTKRDADGALLEEGYLLHGKRVSTWSTWDNGFLYSVVPYVNDLPHGQAVEFDHRRFITARRNYNQGKLDGISAVYKSGRPMTLQTYKNGVLHGESIDYFKQGIEQGSVRQTMNYKNGELDGPMKFYDEKGNVTLEYKYANGQKIE